MTGLGEISCVALTKLSSSSLDPREEPRTSVSYSLNLSWSLSKTRLGKLNILSFVYVSFLVSTSYRQVVVVNDILG